MIVKANNSKKEQNTAKALDVSCCILVVLINESPQHFQNWKLACAEHFVVWTLSYIIKINTQILEVTEQFMSDMGLAS